MKELIPFTEWIMRGASYLAVALSTLAAMILISAAAPGFVRRVRDAARSGMRRCFVWGVVFFANVVLVAALLALVDGVLGSVTALALMVALLVISFAGLAAVAGVIGHRVLALADRSEASALTRVTAGTAVLFATAVIPIFGWLVFAGALLTGVGAFLETAVEDWGPTRRPVPARSPLAQPE